MNNGCGPMPQGLTQQAANFQSFIDASQSGSKVFYGPLYSAANLLGIAPAATAVLPAQSIPYFQASEGMVGQGWAAPLTFAETNLDGAPGQLPSGWAFAAHSLGIYVPTSVPLHIKDWLTRFTALFHVRHTHRWCAGMGGFWPEGLFGHSSPSVTTTVANTQIQFGANGRTGARQFPEGAELYFPPKEVIKFELETYAPVTLTTDGLALGQDNALTECVIYIVMEGWRFEALTA